MKKKGYRIWFSVTQETIIIKVTPLHTEIVFYVTFKVFRGYAVAIAKPRAVKL